VTIWLAIGHLVVGGLFWLLLNVPESNAAMLLASAAVILMIVVAASVVEGAAAVWLDRTADHRSAAARLPAAIVACLAAAIAFWIVWWVTGRASRWLSTHGGEMDAWLLLRFNITRTARLHNALDWIVTVIRFVVGLSLAASLVAMMTVDGPSAIGRAIVRSFSPVRLLFVGLAWAVLLWLPWSVVYWRPKTIEVGLEPLFVGVKLALLYAIMNAGVAVVLAIPTRRRA
jgi:hypothetical protein